MPMKPATEQDTFDHILGSGAFSCGWSWWLKCVVTGTKPNGYDVNDGWQAEITADDGNGGTVTKTVNHQVIMTAARAVISELPRFASAYLPYECSHLLFNADEADFDAPLADELLQVMVLGEIIYG